MIVNDTLQSIATDLFTATKKSAVTFMSFTNIGDEVDYLTVYIVNSGDTADDNNILVKNFIIDPEDILSFSDERLILEAGDKLVGLSDNETISYNISVMELV